MPIHSGKDRQGYFYQWGQTGKKYYYDPISRQSATTAYNKAKKQQVAIYSSGWKGDEEMKMKLVRVVKSGDAVQTKEQVLKRLDDALVKMDLGMREISKVLKDLRVVDKTTANEKQAIFNKLTNYYYELGSNL